MGSEMCIRDRLDPPHSLHLLFWRLWGHMLDPRHSLHLLLMRSCSHMPDPPHSLHLLFWRLCGHLPDGMMLSKVKSVLLSRLFRSKDYLAIQYAHRVC